MNAEVIEEIMNANKVIEDNINNIKDYCDRGLLSQNILSQLRNLVEDIIVLNHNKKYGTNLGKGFEDKKKAYNCLETYCKPKFLNYFHKCLQKSKSHYTPDYNGADILMQKYYSYLLELRKFTKKEFGLNILNNICDYPINNDKSFEEYYEKIALEIEKVKVNKDDMLKNERYYVEKKLPFYINGKMYYEITLSNATDHINKFDRMVVFTKLNILPNYAIMASFVEKNIEMFSSQTSIKIITNWRVSIRPCELNNLSKIFGINSLIKGTMPEYSDLMDYLTEEKINLLDLVLLSDEYYEIEWKKIKFSPMQTNDIFNLLNCCRRIIQEEKEGTNILRYLLYTMRNINIKNQLSKDEGLFGLHLKNKCYPFEKLPFIMSLHKHTPSGDDLFMSLNIDSCDSQLLARHIRNNVEQKGILYTPIDELEKYGDIDKLISEFNSKLYGEKQYELTIKRENNFVYMLGYEDSTCNIIKIINGLIHSGLNGYKESFEFWEKEVGYTCAISDEKKEILKQMYQTSRVSLIYGAAGTGKSTLISCVVDFFSNKNKICLANTNTAVENLKRMVKVKSCEFYTIAKFLNRGVNQNCDILIIDECSTVSNMDILNVLKNTKFELLLLVGDIHQIESIQYGNWFTYAKELINSNSVYELSETFRSDEEKLLTLWNKIRNSDDGITEYIVHSNFSSELNQKIFEEQDKDEIILCLGYNGLYGINQINRYMQDKNPNEEHEFGIKSYKIGDPVLFIDTKRFNNVFYNNLKGIITKILENESEIYFEIEIEKVLNALDVMNSNVNLIETKKESSIVGFTVNKEFEHEDDDEDKNNIVPFNVAYAVSIHKAQGLEYRSVKVVLTNDVENLISPNIFYTAVTRAKKKLSIFWTPETSELIIEKIKKQNDKKDFYYFRNKKKDELSEVSEEL